MKRPLETLLPERLARLREVLLRRQDDLTLILENIHDPHNIAAILRTADAVGISTVHVINTEKQVPSKFGKKSSASARKWVDVHRWKEAAPCISELRSQGFSVIATALSSEAKPIHGFDLCQRVAIAFGNEHDGVSNTLIESSDALMYIPMMGMVQSLNVSVACGVALYESLRQREGNGQYRLSDASDPNFKKRLENWANR